MNFNQPTSGGGFLKPAEHQNHLLLFTNVKRSDRRYDELRKGEIDEFTVDVVDLDGDQLLRENVKVGHVGITNKLTVGATNVLGRISTVDTGKGNPAWVLVGFNDADVPKAQAWVEAQKANSFAQPKAPDFVAAPVAPAPAASAASLLSGMTSEQIALLQAQLGAKPAF